MPVSTVLLLLWSVGSLLGLALLLLSREEARPPEWVFPVRGRWLRYFLRGSGILLLIASAPLWGCILVPTVGVAALLLLPVGVIAMLAKLVDRAQSRRMNSEGTDEVIDFIPTTEEEIVQS